MEETKQCTKCKQAKPFSEFYKSKEGKYGVMAQCKLCSQNHASAVQLRPKTVVESKECSQCHEVKLAKEFGAYARSSDGLASECKSCHSRYYGEAKKSPKVACLEKECSECHTIKLAKEFYANPASSNGLLAACKVCTDARNKRWEKAHPQERRKIANASFKRAYHDPEKQPFFKENSAAWKQANPEKVKEHAAHDREKNFDKPTRKQGRRRQRIKWFGEHPGYKRTAAHKRRALIKNAPVIDTDINIFILYKRDNGICCLCGKKVNEKLRWPDLMCGTIEHIIPLSKGGEHSWANVSLAHHRCNSLKNNKTVQQQLRLF